MRRLLAVAVVAATISAPAQAQAMTVSLAVTPDGPQVYRSGHLNGWTVEESLFLDVNSGAETMGPILFGSPPVTPESSVRLRMTPDGPKVDEWIGRGADWQPEMVLFRSAHRQGGAGMFLDLIAPWPKDPRLHRLLTIPAH